MNNFWENASPSITIAANGGINPSTQAGSIDLSTMAQMQPTMPMQLTQDIIDAAAHAQYTVT